MYILPFILLINNLDHRASRHTVSKAFSKSTNAAKSFFFFNFISSKKECKTKILSTVEYPLSMNVIYNGKKFPFQRYVLHVHDVVEYVLNVVEHGVYKYLFLNVKENEISVYLNCEKVYIFLSVKYYILKWMKICISKLQTYISILIEIVYHVYILFSEYMHCTGFPVCYL